MLKLAPLPLDTILATQYYRLYLCLDHCTLMQFSCRTILKIRLLPWLLPLDKLFAIQYWRLY